MADKIDRRFMKCSFCGAFSWTGIKWDPVIEFSRVQLFVEYNDFVVCV